MKPWIVFVCGLLWVANIADAETWTLVPGVTVNGDSPDTWTVDLRGKTQEEAQAIADGISLRLYGPANALHETMVFLTDSEEPLYFSFHIDAVSRNGSELKVSLDDAYYASLTWAPASETIAVDQAYYFAVGSGEHQVELKVSSLDTVRMLSYAISDSLDALPAGAEEISLTEDDPTLADEKALGYRGIWYGLGQYSEYGDKYSGGLGTYTAYHNPIAIYSEEANKTFFVYGGTPDASQRYLLCMVGCYDHETGMVERPTIVFDKGVLGVDDPHDNPALLIDDEGYIWVYVAGRNTTRDGYLMKSTEPYSIDAFEEVHLYADMAYPQPWQSDDGVLFMFVKYTAGREIYLATSPDGENWSSDRKLVGFGGHYQVTNYNRPLHKLATFFNYHPGGSSDDRTNLYYMQSVDGGDTWTTVDGEELTISLSDRNNPALVIDYEADGKLQYPCDLNWDAEGNPLLLYVTSFDHAPGPDGGPRDLCLTSWDGEEWMTTVITQTTHNYDMGSIYVDGSRWTVLFPSESGPDEWGTGGEIIAWTSDDSGQTWTRQRAVTRNSERNHSYVRRPLNAQAPFYGLWADGDADSLSVSNLYITNRDGTRVWQLPYTMEEDWEAPIEIAPPIDRWKEDSFSSEDLGDDTVSGVDSDPDHDGVVNLLEYAFRGNPSASDFPGIAWQIYIEGGQLYAGIRYDLSVDSADVTVVPMIADSPSGPWYSGETYLTEVSRQRINSASGEMERIEVRDIIPLTNAERRFMKLSVELN